MLTFDFTGDSGILSYLKGKEFKVDRSLIWFMGEFE